MAQPQNTISFGSLGQDPETAAQMLALQRQQQLADMLKQQSAQGLGNTEMVSGIAIRKSPLEMLGRLAEGYMGRQMEKENDAKMADIAAQRNKALADALMNYSSGGMPTGATPADGAPAATNAVGNGAAVAPAQNAKLAAALRINQLDPKIGELLLKDNLTTPDAVKTMDLLGQNRGVMGQLATAEARKKGIIELQPGTTAIDLATGIERFQPKVGEGIALDKNGIASPIPGYAQSAASLTGANAQATEQAKAQNEMTTLNMPNGPIMVTKAQAVQMANGGAPAAQAGAPGVVTDQLLDSLRKVESGGNNYAVNKQSGAMGPYQFMPGTVAALHQQGIKFNPFDEKESREAARAYLGKLVQQNGGDLNKALAAYGGFVTKDPSGYINKVLGGSPQQSAAQVPAQQAPGIPLQGAAASTGEVERGKFFGQNYANLQNSAMAANGKIAALDRFSDLLDGVKTGKLTPSSTQLAAYAASMGINIDKNLGVKQAAEAISNELALQLRNPSGGAGMPGAMSDADRNYLRSMVPGLDNSPQGNALKIEFMKKMALRDQQIAELARNYNGGNLDNNFYSVVQQFANSNPMFAKPQQAGQGAPTAAPAGFRIIGVR